MKVRVELTRRPEIADPQGTTIKRALEDLNFTGVTSVRVDKVFHLEIEADDPEFDGIWANTTDLRGEPAFITPFGIYRGARVHFVDVVFKANSNAPIADGELVTMSGRALPDPGPTPIPLRF
jgi:hypothetical protein